MITWSLSPFAGNANLNLSSLAFLITCGSWIAIFFIQLEFRKPECPEPQDRSNDGLNQLMTAGPENELRPYWWAGTFTTTPPLLP